MAGKKPGGGSRHTTPPEASLASAILAGRIKPTTAQVMSLAASVLSQDAPKKAK